MDPKYIPIKESRIQTLDEFFNIFKRKQKETDKTGAFLDKENEVTNGIKKITYSSNLIYVRTLNYTALWYYSEYYMNDKIKTIVKWEILDKKTYDLYIKSGYTLNILVVKQSNEWKKYLVIINEKKKTYTLCDQNNSYLSDNNSIISIINSSEIKNEFNNLIYSEIDESKS